MSSTRQAVISNVRRALNDLDPMQPAFDPDRYYRSVEANAQLLSAEVWQGTAWVAAAITYASGTAIYTLPTSVQYAQLLEFKRDYDGLLLTRVSPEQMVAEQANSSTASTGAHPTIYALQEDTSQQVIITLWPTPGAAGTIQVRRSAVLGAMTLANAVIPFSEPLCRALEWQVAAELASCLAPDQLGQLGISPESPKTWLALAGRAVKAERERVAALKSLGYIEQVEAW